MSSATRVRSEGSGVSTKYEVADAARKTADMMANIRPKSATRAWRKARRSSEFPGTVMKSSPVVDVTWPRPRVSRGLSLPPMPYYLLEYELAPDYLERRTALRPEHLALAKAAEARGELRLAGALAEPPDRAFLVWRVSEVKTIEDFVAADPYVRHGLVLAWRVRSWTVVVGADKMDG